MIKVRQTIWLSVEGWVTRLVRAEVTHAEGEAGPTVWTCAHAWCVSGCIGDGKPGMGFGGWMTYTNVGTACSWGTFHARSWRCSMRSSRKGGAMGWRKASECCGCVGWWQTWGPDLQRGIPQIPEMCVWGMEWTELCQWPGLRVRKEAAEDNSWVFSSRGWCI